MVLLTRMFHTSIERESPRRVRARGLQRLLANPCRPGPLTRRLAVWIMRAKCTPENTHTTALTDSGEEFNVGKFWHCSP